MTSITSTLTKPRPELKQAPFRGLALLFGLAQCGHAVSQDAAITGVAQMAFGILVLFAAVAPLRFAVPTFAYLLVTMSFMRIRALADDTALATHYDYPVAVDEFIFQGTVLNVWLQDLLYVPGRIGPLDAALAAVYFSYFLMPTVMALFLWKVRPNLFSRFAWALILTLGFGVMIYFLVPTAPPWLASDTGRIEPVVRVIPSISAALAGDAYEQAAANLDKNAVAAMPSLHVALTVVIASVIAQFGRRWAQAGVAYVAAMCLALVYLGEHYVIDEVAGIALGVATWRVSGFASRLRQGRDMGRREGLGLDVRFRPYPQTEDDVREAA